jgi:hypothetical protein
MWSTSYQKIADEYDVCVMTICETVEKFKKEQSNA